MQSLKVIDQNKIEITEYILKFFINFKNKTMSIGISTESEDTQLKFVDYLI